MRNLNELVGTLTEDIDVMIEAMLEKEQKLADLFKKTSKIMSEYEKETEEMVKQLYKARDEQVFAVLKKFIGFQFSFQKLKIKNCAANFRFKYNKR